MKKKAGLIKRRVSTWDRRGTKPDRVARAGVALGERSVNVGMREARG